MSRNAFQIAGNLAGQFAGVVQQGANLSPWYSPLSFTDTKAKKDTTLPTFMGSIIDVGVGKPYTTLSAASSAASSGDVIITHDAVMDMSAESSGYFLLNTANKSLKIRSNLEGGTKLIQSTGSYGIRFRDIGSAKILFENIEIEGNSCDGIYQGGFAINAYFNNCTIRCTNASSAEYALKLDLKAGTSSKVLFKDCTVERTNTVSTSRAILARNEAGQEIIFDNCIVTSDSGTIINSNSIYDLAIYDSEFYTEEGSYVIAMGEDVNQPAKSLTGIDIRNSKIYHKSLTEGGHAMLLGRGVAEANITNNYLSTPYVSEPLYLGMVIKSTPAQLGDVVIKGNYIYAYRPYLIKGGQYNDIQYNVGVCHDVDSVYTALQIVNPVEADGAINSRNNTIKNNRFVGTDWGFMLSSETGAETGDLSAQNCDIDNNTYYATSGKYLKSDDGTEIVFDSRATFWGNDNDENSAFRNPSKGGVTLNEYFVPN